MFPCHLLMYPLPSAGVNSYYRVYWTRGIARFSSFVILVLVPDEQEVLRPALCPSTKWMEQYCLPHVSIVQYLVLLFA
jgi:hypothetical protein